MCAKRLAPAAALLSLSMLAFTVVLSAQSATGSKKMVAIYGNGQLAQLIYLGRTASGVEHMLFKGPSGLKVKAEITPNLFPGYLTRIIVFLPRWKSCEIVRYMGAIFVDQRKTVPVAYQFLGIDERPDLIDDAVCGLVSTGQNRDFETRLEHAFATLPAEAQLGVREFYQFAVKASETLQFFSQDCDLLFGHELNLDEFVLPYQVSEDPFAADAFAAEFQLADNAHTLFASGLYSLRVAAQFKRIARLLMAFPWSMRTYPTAVCYAALAARLEL